MKLLIYEIILKCQNEFTAIYNYNMVFGIGWCITIRGSKDIIKILSYFIHTVFHFSVDKEC